MNNLNKEAKMTDFEIHIENMKSEKIKPQIYIARDGSKVVTGYDPREPKYDACFLSNGQKIEFIV